MIVFFLIINVVLIVIFILMAEHISGIHKTIEQMSRTLTSMAKSMGCIESKTEPEDGVDEEFMGYTVTSDVRKTVKAFKNDGIYTKAEDELRRATHMPHDVAAAYLDQLGS